MRRAAVTLASLLLLGCPDPKPPPAEDTQMGCRDDDECPTALRCRFGACVGEVWPDWPISLRMLPRPGDDIPSVELRSIQFSENAVLDMGTIRLPKASRLTGRVKLPSGDGLEVRASARATTGILELALNYQGESFRDLDGPGFSISLPQTWPTDTGSLRSVLYELTLFPDDAARHPPWRITDFRIPDGDPTVVMVLPEPSQMARLDGEVRVSESNPTPISGMRVYATDGGGRRISSEMVTDDAGQFALYFWPAPQARNVTVRLRRTGESGPVPDLERVVRVPGVLGEDVPFESFVLGNIGDAFSVSGRVGDAEPIPGASLRFRGQVGNGIFGIDVPTTDEDGRFKATLYEGLYAIDVVSPPQSRYRIARFQLPVADGDALTLAPEPRASMTGLVVDPSASPVQQARIRAELMTPNYADLDLNRAEQSAPSRTRQVETDAEGRFALLLDPGDHRLHVEIAPRRGLPAVQMPITIPPLDTFIPGVRVAIPPAAALVADIIASDGTPALGVAVEAWRTDTSPPRRVAAAVTDQQGSLTLAIPAE